MLSAWVAFTISILAAPTQAAESDRFSLHFQATAITQAHPDFYALYSGLNSLSNAAEADTSFTSTLFAGARLWKGAALFINPEVSAGSGLSGTHGVAGFPNGEVFRVGTPSPKLYVARLFLAQDFAIGDSGVQVFKSDQNVIAGERPVSRLSLYAGKFALTDFFDLNRYAHDPRTQFFNWALMDNVAWDYAGDVRGLSWGLVAEFNQEKWALRWASVLETTLPNGTDFDDNIAQARGDNLEGEYRFLWNTFPGVIRGLFYVNHAHMGLYTAGTDISQSRDYRIKWGFGLNFEQQLTSELGIFSRAGWNDGTTETWNFTEVDRTLTVGAVLQGTPWRRPEDFVGLALVWNGLSSEHMDYLATGGYGFMIGDGALSYAPEEILEAYYLFQIFSFFNVTANYQFVNHPAYNQDRGPVSIFGLRLHAEL